MQGSDNYPRPCLFAEGSELLEKGRSHPRQPPTEDLMTTRRIVVTVIASFCFGAIFSSCSTGPITSVPPRPAPDWNVSLLDNTIGAIADLAGLQRIPVRGYGLVIGLPGTGSRECPEQIRDIIQGGFRGRTRPDGSALYADVDARALIGKLSTAVVVVEGWIPPAAAAGDRIDLNISALPNTQTTSLADGELLVCELATEVVSMAGAPIRRSPMVVAAYPELAPVFVNPFTKADSAKRPVSLRSARIIGGGRVLRTRPLNLVLRVPSGSYPIVRQIARRINFRFPSLSSELPTAQAERANTVKLIIPREYHNRQRHFLMLVLQTYLSSDPAYIATQSRQLIAELSNPKSQADRITAALESVGKSTLPDLRRAYESSDPRVAFYAARTAALLDDLEALSLLGRIAADDSSPYQLLATSVLSELPHPYRANQFLRPLLDSRNSLVRIRAYEGLARNADPSVLQVRFDRPAEFALDLVLSKGQPLIYVQTTKEPRIVLIGQQTRCRIPVFYLSRDKLLTISSTAHPAQHSNADAEPPEQLSLLRRTPTGDIGGILQSSPDLVSLIKTLGSDVEPDYKGVRHGLGMNYSKVVAALYGLWQNKDIPAGFVLQQSPAARALVERPTAWAAQRPETSSP